MSLRVTNLHKEWRGTELVAVNYNLSKDDCVVSSLSHLSWPPLCCCDSWRVDDELVSCLVKSCRCLKPSNIRSVAKLSLGIATKYPKLFAKRNPLCLLLLTAHDFNDFGEHEDVHGYRWLPKLVVVPLKFRLVSVSKARIPVNFVQIRNLFPPRFNLLFASHFIKLMIVLENGILLHPECCTYLVKVLSLDELAQSLLAVKVFFGSFFKQISRHNFILPAALNTLHY